MCLCDFLAVALAEVSGVALWENRINATVSEENREVVRLACKCFIG